MLIVRIMTTRCLFVTLINDSMIRTLKGFLVYMLIIVGIVVGVEISETMPWISQLALLPVYVLLFVTVQRSQIPDYIFVVRVNGGH